MNTLFRRTQRFVLSSMAIVMVSLASAAAVSAEDCEDFTPNNRPCTASQEWIYCMANAWETSVECDEDADNFLGRVACAVFADLDYLACTLATPVDAVFKD